MQLMQRFPVLVGVREPCVENREVAEGADTLAFIGKYVVFTP